MKTPEVLFSAFRLNINYTSDGLMTTSRSGNIEVLTIKNEVKHAAYSSYRCQSQIAFAFRKDIGKIFRKLCNEMKVEIIEVYGCNVVGMRCMPEAGL